MLKYGRKKSEHWYLARFLITSKNGDGLVRVMDIRIITGILHRNYTIVVPLPFYDNVGLQFMAERDAPAILLIHIPPIIVPFKLS